MDFTISIEDDLLAQLTATAQAAGVDVNLLVKALIRDALKSRTPPGPVQPRPYVQRSYNLGLRPEFNWDKALTIAGQLEDEDIGRKLCGLPNKCHI
jgi:hypothetical protein